METDIPQGVMENCGMDEHLEKASLSNNGSVEENRAETLTNSNGARKKHLKSSKKISTAENSFSVNSSSVSSATVSGTPPQPTSRRQSFITLEKFDCSENRPFSPSPLNNISTITVKSNQESMTKTDNPPKVKRREMTLSKADSDKIVQGIKRSSRRSSKTEQTGNKRSKTSKSEEKTTQESVDNTVISENNSPALLNQTECVLTSQAQFSESAMEHEDTMIKPTESSLLGNNAEETTLGMNLECKENTPPAVTPADQIVNEENHSQITPNQKTLRRSLRRRSETIETAVDNQDKENHQKKERHKEEEKTPQKSSLPVKDDIISNQRLISEQTVQENLIEKGDQLHEKTDGETTADSEIDENGEKPNTETLKSEGDGSQDNTNKTFEIPVRGRTRYQTRRASQGLLSSIENSESDSSEAKEEGSRKRRTGKWKNKSSDNIDVEDQEKVMKQENIKVGNSEDSKLNCEVGGDIKPQICEDKEDNTKDSTVCVDLHQVTDDLSDTHEMKDKTSKCAEHSLSNLVPEPNLRTRNASKRLNKRESIENNSAEESSKIGTSDISLHSDNMLQVLECQHKRSRRVRKSKGCDCCGEKSQPPEKSLVLKNTENYDVKSNETKNTEIQTPESETSKSNSSSEMDLSQESHSINVHVGFRENDTASDLLITSENELKENAVPLEIVTYKEKPCDSESKESIFLESQEPANNKCEIIDPFNPKDISVEGSALEPKEETTEHTSKKELSTENSVNIEANLWKEKPEFSSEIEDKELDVEGEKSESSVSEQKDGHSDISEMVTEENGEKSNEFEGAAEEQNAKEAATEDFSSGSSHSPNARPVKASAQAEISEETLGESKCDQSLPEETSAEMENCEKAVIGEASPETETSPVSEKEDQLAKASKPVETEKQSLHVEIANGLPKMAEAVSEEGKLDLTKTDTNTELKSEETIEDNRMAMEKDDNILQQVHTIEKVEESTLSSSETANSELITEDNSSPQKSGELDSSLVSVCESPSGMQTRCVWSPLASPSTSILKRGLKRPQEDESSSPVNKVGEPRLSILPIC